jgi:hypothetical protein
MLDQVMKAVAENSVNAFWFHRFFKMILRRFVVCLWTVVILGGCYDVS